MLEEKADFSQHPGALAGSLAALRGKMMALINDQ